MIPPLGIQKTAEELLSDPSWPKVITKACCAFNNAHEDDDIYSTIFEEI